MELEEVLLRLETERGWTNTEYLHTKQIDLIKDILEIVNNNSSPIKYKKHNESNKNIFGTIKVLQILLEQAENNNGTIEITDTLLKDLIQNTIQEYEILTKG